jgi:hypothetical protein
MVYSHDRSGRSGRRGRKLLTGLLVALLAAAGMTTVAAAPANAAVGSTVQEAAQLLVAAHNSGKLETVPTSIYDLEIAPAASGASSSGCTVDLRVLQVLNLAVDRFGYVRVTDIQRPCIGSSVNCDIGSGHCATPATALDIDRLGSSSTVVDGSSAVTLQYLDMLNNVATGTASNPIGIRAGQSLCGRTNSWTHIATFDDKCNHQHIDFVGINASLNVATSPIANTASTVLSLGADGTLRGKTGLSGEWVVLQGGVADMDVASDTAGTPVIAILTTDGLVKTKVGLGGVWTTQIGNVTSFGITTQGGASTLAVVRTDGTLQAKGDLNGAWTTLGGGVKQVSVTSDRVNTPTISAVYTDGTLRAKTGIQGPWVDLAGGVVTVDTTADTTNGPSWVIVRANGVASAKTGLNGYWVDIASSMTGARIASSAASGVVFAATGTNGALYGKVGINGTWTGLLDGVSSADVALSPSGSLTFVAAASGTIYGKSGVNGPWAVLGSAAKVVLSN